MTARTRLRPHPVAWLLALLAVLLELAVLVAAAAPPASASRSGQISGQVAETGTGTWPLDPTPEVVSPFTPPEQPWLGGHRGVDLAGSIGQPVRAALAGRVSFAGRIAGVGVVVVDHGGTRTTYQPVTAAVDVGDLVPTGGRLGTLAWYGTHCLPRACLHWGWLRGAAYLDPLDLVGGGPRPVRLLPTALPGPAGGLLRLSLALRAAR